MADPTPRSDDLARHARQHLDSLKASGVEWLPNAPPPPRRRRIAPAADAADAAPSLFEEQAPAQAGGDLPADQRRHELAVLADQVRPCMRCTELAATRTQTVFGV